MLFNQTMLCQRAHLTRNCFPVRADPCCKIKVRWRRCDRCLTCRTFPLAGETQQLSDQPLPYNKGAEFVNPLCKTSNLPREMRQECPSEFRTAVHNLPKGSLRKPRYPHALERDDAR